METNLESRWTEAQERNHYITHRLPLPLILEYLAYIEYERQKGIAKWITMEHILTAFNLQRNDALKAYL